MNSPLVSVVIAAWNAAAYLPETLVSALEQTWPNLEVILVDDGSTDDTAAATAPFLPQIRYERRSHQGLAAARNEGIRLAKGDYIALLDADDLWHSEKIAIQVAIAQQNPHSGLIACDANEFSNAKVLRESLFPGFVAPAVQASPTGQITRDFQRELIEDNLITCPAQVLLPRQVVEQIGPFTDSGAQDYDYYLRVSRNYPITLHREILARWRFRPDSMSGSRADRRIRWNSDTLPVLLAHRQRCRTEDRGLLERRIRKHIASLSYHLMVRGRERRRLATSSLLLKLFRDHPRSPSPLMCLAGLWSPNLMYWIASRTARRMRQTKASERLRSD
jgi:glycosyltransferase involved in cell wall biosynthesis